MKSIGLFFVVALLFVGCAKFQHSETLNVDPTGATGIYQDSRFGKLHTTSFGAAGGGGGWGSLARAAKSVASGGLGAGGMGFQITSDQSQGDPRNFARAVATIDMSKKLKSVSYNEETGVHEYEFVQPLGVAEKTSTRGSQPPPSFGRSPVQ